MRMRLDVIINAHFVELKMIFRIIVTSIGSVYFLTSHQSSYLWVERYLVKF